MSNWPKFRPIETKRPTNSNSTKQLLADAQREHEATQNQQRQIEHDRLTQQSLKEQAKQRLAFAGIGIGRLPSPDRS